MRTRHVVALIAALTVLVSGGVVVGAQAIEPAAPAVVAAPPAVIDVAARTRFVEVHTAVVAQRTADRPAIRQYLKARKIADMRARIVRLARKQIGDTYRAGRSGPSSFDCSGLVLYVYRAVTGKNLPHSSRTQYGVTKRIGRKQARPGDLVFFLRGGAHHVGIYIGRGRMIDAPGYGRQVRVSPISGDWWGSHFTGFGRALPA